MKCLLLEASNSNVILLTECSNACGTTHHLKNKKNKWRAKQLKEYELLQDKEIIFLVVTISFVGTRKIPRVSHLGIFFSTTFKFIGMSSSQVSFMFLDSPYYAEGSFTAVGGWRSSVSWLRPKGYSDCWTFSSVWKGLVLFKSSSAEVVLPDCSMAKSKFECAPWLTKGWLFWLKPRLVDHRLTTVVNQLGPASWPWSKFECAPWLTKGWLFWLKPGLVDHRLTTVVNQLGPASWPWSKFECAPWLTKGWLFWLESRMVDPRLTTVVDHWLTSVD